MSTISDTQYNELVDEARKAFTPFTPITLVELFKGRTAVIGDIISELGSPGRHVILFGDRGVGKTSVVNLLPFYSRLDESLIVDHRCDQSSTFETIFGDVLTKCGTTHTQGKMVSASSRKLAAPLTPHLGLEINQTTSVEYSPLRHATELTPQRVVELLDGKRALVVIDEYDRIRETLTHVRVADLIKHLSDASSSTKLLVVGVAESIMELIGSHPSISRNIAEIHLQRMSDPELREIIQYGFQDLKLVCPDSTEDRIVGLSDGYPHFTHLLCLRMALACADRLVENDNQKREILTRDYSKGLQGALRTSYESLRTGYRTATETVRKKSDGYKHVLEGVASDSQCEVQINQIVHNINRLYGKQITQLNINGALGALVNDRKVLERPRTGYYKFSDPMMRAYVRMQLEQSRIETDNRQMSFPFMP